MLPGVWGEQPHIKSRRISLLDALCWRRGAWKWGLNMGEVGAEDGRHWGWNMGEVAQGCGRSVWGGLAGDKKKRFRGEPEAFALTLTGWVYLAMKGSRCQMSLAYSAMVRSLENLPAQAVFMSEALFHAFGSR